MKKLIVLLIVLATAGSGYCAGRANDSNEVVTTAVETVIIENKPVVQLAILLDTSGSMSGLINQARIQLWSIVNEFIFAKREGIAPEVQVALFEYGKSTVPQKDGYVRLIVPFTTDLDKLSEELFALTTNGGDEYCGWVIKDAVEKLKWSDKKSDLKLIFIAGNEPFTQGKVDYKVSCKAAIEKGIVVNTIHCGTESSGINGEWKNGALLADGRFLNIDQNQAIFHIEAPQDADILSLNSRLNETYIAYGIEGIEMAERQEAQDSSNMSLSVEAALQRVVAKSSFNYKNAGWDLVDAINEKQIKLDDIETEKLPENMQKMNMEERKAYVAEQTKKRAEIQNKIQKLNEQRKKYVDDEMNKLEQAGNTLGTAVIKAIHEQAQKKNFEFKQPEEQAKSDAENTKEN